MARVLGNNQNTLKIHDNISNSDIVLFYRNPTTSERNGYANTAIKRHRNKVKLNQVEARITYGLKILTGFRDGDFSRQVDGKAVPMASDKSSANFHEDWKGLLEIHAADIIMLLAAHVFDASSEIDDPEDSEDAGKNLNETSPQ